MIVAVRAHGNPAALAATLRLESKKIDPDVAVARVQTLESLAAESIAPQHFGALLLALFAGAAVLLAGIGVYGVMSYIVSQRRHDIGVRLALGASPRDVFVLVVLRGLALAAVGAALGLAGALALGPLMQSLLSGVTPTERSHCSPCRSSSPPSRSSPARYRPKGVADRTARSLRRL